MADQQAGWSVSAIVVAYNSAGTILRCFDAVLASHRLPDEIIIIDNASTDGTDMILRDARAVNLSCVRNPKNTGFSAALNQGIARARGNLILSLNPDAYLSPPALGALIDALVARNDTGAATPRMVRSDGCIDSAGIEVKQTVSFRNRGEGEPDRGQYNAAEDIFGASCACVLYRRDTLLSLSVDGEIFDEDFFAYKEDIDLSLRMRRAGWRTRYVPEALVRHDRSLRAFRANPTKSNTANGAAFVRASLAAVRDRRCRVIRALSLRNQQFVVIKNIAVREILRPDALVRSAISLALYIALYPFICRTAGPFFAGIRRMLYKRRIINGSQKNACADQSR